MASSSDLLAADAFDWFWRVIFVIVCVAILALFLASIRAMRQTRGGDREE